MSRPVVRVLVSCLVYRAAKLYSNDLVVVCCGVRWVAILSVAGMDDDWCGVGERENKYIHTGHTQHTTHNTQQHTHHTQQPHTPHNTHFLKVLMASVVSAVLRCCFAMLVVRLGNKNACRWKEFNLEFAGHSVGLDGRSMFLSRVGL
jgi:hypothetical protein